MSEKQGIYIASKVVHAERWKQLRDNEGYPIISHWIDCNGPEDPVAMQILWERVMEELRRCAVLIAYIEEGEILKGGLVEIGGALASGAKVLIVGDQPELRTVRHHSNIEKVGSLAVALHKASNICKSLVLS